MKEKITDEIRDILTQSTEWIKLEAEYAKLTLVEKFSVMAGMGILFAIIMMLALPLFIMLLFALQGLLARMMSPALAYLTTGGIVVVLTVVIVLLRKPLVFNPITRFITRLLVERQNKH